MSSKLVIVESPAKARTIAGILGGDYVVESSIGHVRDLPRSAADIPKSYKDEAWARLGVDTENDFKPLYIVPKEKSSQITKLKKLVKEADELYLATDEDREGESIAWHLTEVLNPRVPVKRMVFHEITPDAIRHAIEQPRDLDRRLVDAQETRRILDRLFGYEVSPVLWKLIRPKLSAGRVQSPAIRIIVERERERMAFRTAEYWDVAGVFATADGSFSAVLADLDGVRVASGKDFDSAGAVARSDVVLLDRTAAEAVVDDLSDSDFSVRRVESKPYKRSPYPPFRTSTLQQEAGRKLRFGSQRTMQVAQRLYENGYITYMRTDSISLSETAVTAARTQVAELYGGDYLPASPRIYTSKVKNAQEAHEAIRPAGDRFRTPDEVARHVGPDESKLYDLIWKRTVASQMADAVGESVQVRLGAIGSSGKDAEFSASGKVITFPGFLRAYVEGSDDPDAELEDQEIRLPPLQEGQALDTESLEAVGHETKPPARYTEASLVKKLEELGIGRPSTYASIISTIQERGYVWKKGSALVPTFLAFATVRLLERHFTDLVDYGFTARMEEDLDEIAGGDREHIPYLASFYFGNGHPGLVELVERTFDAADAKEINTIPFDGGEDVVLRSGRYGPYLERGEDRVSVPEDLPPDELTLEKATELLEAPSGERLLGSDPDTGLDVIAKSGRFGPYVQLGESDDQKGKPKTASLLKSMGLDTVTLEEALRLLSLPRVVGEDPESGEEITAQNGRYGPYLKKGSDTRSLEAEGQIFEIDLEGALALFAQPKQRRGARSAKPLKALGVEPGTGYEVEVRDGRFGPYVTDGGVNASLRRDDSVEKITLERAAELLAERRAKLEAEGKTVKPGKKAPSPQPPASSKTEGEAVSPPPPASGKKET
ncbi:MAG TPA: type I DNA topoisomerase [Acidimicrobiia bacterium]|nr:type I DNA topoisomerase [Acidimicrobiia bacterium]